MNQQSNVIFAALFIAFLAFITMRGELRKYMGFLLATPTGAAPATQTSDSGATTQTALNTAAQILPMVLV